MNPIQGEIWWAEAEDKRRPVLVITRSEAIPVLGWAVVAPVTRSIRQIPTEIRLGTEQGLPSPCVATFESLQPVRKVFLTERLESLLDHPRQICHALSALADC